MTLGCLTRWVSQNKVFFKLRPIPFVTSFVTKLDMLQDFFSVSSHALLLVVVGDVFRRLFSPRRKVRTEISKPTFCPERERGRDDEVE